MIEKIKDIVAFIMGVIFLHAMMWILASPLFVEEQKEKSDITYFNPCADVGQEICTYSLSVACDPGLCKIGYISLPLAIILMVLCGLFWAYMIYRFARLVLVLIKIQFGREEDVHSKS